MLLQQNRIRGFQFFANPSFRSTMGHTIPPRHSPFSSKRTLNFSDYCARLTRRAVLLVSPHGGRTSPRRVRHRSHYGTDTCRLATGSGATGRTRPDEHAQCGYLRTLVVVLLTGLDESGCDEAALPNCTDQIAGIELYRILKRPL